MPLFKLSFTDSDSLGLQVLKLAENIRVLSRLVPREENVVSFASLSWASPLTVLPLAAILCESSQKIGIRPPLDKGTRDYLATINFPLGCGSMRGLKKDRSYIPIVSAGEKSSEVTKNELITEVRNLLVGRIDPSPAVVNSLAHSMAEVFVNIWEHSKSKRGWILAQNYPSKNFVDICILDTGMGIKGAYERVGIAVEDERKAVEKALSGVSTKDEERGKGLPTTRNLLINSPLKGNLAIITGNLAYIERKDETNLFDLSDVSWQGTIVLLRIKNTSANFDYTKYI